MRQEFYTFYAPFLGSIFNESDNRKYRFCLPTYFTSDFSYMECRENLGLVCIGSTVELHLSGSWLAGSAWPSELIC